MDSEQPEPTEQSEFTEQPASTEEAPRTSERRDSYRVEYPIEERPRLVLEGGKSCAVRNVSEYGLCYRITEPFNGEIGDPIAGMLYLHEGERVKIEGNVVRIDEREVALHLEKKVSFAILIAEQRYLRKKYLLWS